MVHYMVLGNILTLEHAYQQESLTDRNLRNVGDKLLRRF